MSDYVVHPGNVTLFSSGETVYIDAGTLAAYYGLESGEYEVNLTQQEQEQMHIHLFPRADGKYSNIKTLLADNGLNYHYDKPVNWEKQKRERRKYI